MNIEKNIKVRQSRKDTFPPVTIPGYEWVSREVNSYCTCFQTPDSIATFKKEVDMTIYDDFESLVVEHCTSDDRVFLKASKSESNFIYFYVDVFKELHIQLLYADFECGMLRTMNIAYVQLHPNINFIILDMTILIPFNTNNLNTPH